LRHVAVVVLALSMVVACNGPTPSASAVSLDLPTYGVLGGTACAMTDLDGWRLAGNPDDPKVTWLQNGPERRDILWPPGYRADFDPTLRVFDRFGRELLREGGGVAGGCSVGDTTYLVEPASFE
jgi:hypothetical protein